MSIPVAALGLSDIVAVTGAAAGVNVDLRPTNHEIWIVHECEYHHDDPAARNVTLYMYDGSNTASIGGKAALATGVYAYLQNDTYLKKPIVVTYAHYLRFTFSGMAAGQKGYLNAFITKIKGLPTDYGT